MSVSPATVPAAQGPRGSSELGFPIGLRRQPRARRLRSVVQRMDHVSAPVPDRRTSDPRRNCPKPQRPSVSAASLRPEPPSLHFVARTADPHDAAPSPGALTSRFRTCSGPAHLGSAPQLSQSAAPIRFCSAHPVPQRPSVSAAAAPLRLPPSLPRRRRHAAQPFGRVAETQSRISAVGQPGGGQKPAVRDALPPQPARTQKTPAQRDGGLLRLRKGELRACRILP